MKSEGAFLVVDDEPLVRMGLSSLLEDCGFDVFEAGTASQAIAVLEANAQFRVVWMIVRACDNADRLGQPRTARVHAFESWFYGHVVGV